MGLLCSHGLFRVQQSALSMLSAQQRVADQILLLASLVYGLVVFVLPGCAVIGFGYAIFAKWEGMTRAMKAGVVVLAIACVIFWAMRVRAAAEAAEKVGPSSAASDPSAAGLTSRTTMGPIGPVHSGEEVCNSEGQCIRLADPTKAEGQAAEGWQQSLAGAMTDAIRRGEEQVVLMFTREGCPWCDRQVPVIHRAIQKRMATTASGAKGVAAPALAFLGGAAGLGGSGLLMAPLRVFVLDAGEFPYLAQQFKIEAFPTSMVFGLPGVTPLVAKGYLDDDNFDQVIRAAAIAPPPAGGVSGALGGGGGGVKPRRRRLFR